nr:MAG TPA: hypothetical protein [Caudoviricetes sp.]
MLVDVFLIVLLKSNSKCFALMCLIILKLILIVNSKTNIF